MALIAAPGPQWKTNALICSTDDESFEVLGYRQMEKRHPMCLPKNAASKDRACQEVRRHFITVIAARRIESPGEAVR